MNLNHVVALLLVLVVVPSVSVSAEQTEIVDVLQEQQTGKGYLIQPGDVLQISVWREPDLQSDVVVPPDGRIALPLLGRIDVDGKNIEALRNEIVARIQRFVPDADVTVSIKQALGNKIYVIGKVNRPGEYVLNRNVDVMQALSMAAGIAKFADVDSIKILRRSGDIKEAISFDYSQVEAGNKLDQNIVLKPGDVVVVP